MKSSVICAAISMWLVISAVDKATAGGTFRLVGPWPSASVQKETTHSQKHVSSCKNAPLGQKLRKGHM